MHASRRLHPEGLAFCSIAGTPEQRAELKELEKNWPICGTVGSAEVYFDGPQGLVVCLREVGGGAFSFTGRHCEEPDDVFVDVAPVLRG